MAEALPRADVEGARAERRTLRLAAIVAGVLLLLAVALWMRYGGAVFVELLAAAWAACF